MPQTYRLNNLLLDATKVIVAPIVFEYFLVTTQLLISLLINTFVRRSDAFYLQLHLATLIGVLFDGIDNIE